MNETKENQQPAGREGSGRLQANTGQEGQPHNSGSTTQADISNVDQQEGAMNNGETGSNDKGTPQHSGGSSNPDE